MANLIITISKALASASRVASVFDITSSQTFGERTAGEDSEFAVELDGVSLKYARAGENSISGVSLKVKHGETVGIIGGTGAGKTSLVNLIPRFYDATEGSVKILGAPIEEYTKKALTDMIRVVPQKAVLFSGSIAENLRFGCQEATDEELMRAVEIAQATDVIELKDGLYGKVEGGGKNFSGGQRQRLTIARALVDSPKILILDDSASALDYATDARLRKAIRDMDGGTTVFIVSQRASSVMYADKIVLLEDGEAVAIGTHEELLSTSEIYREIYESQFGKEARV